MPMNDTLPNYAAFTHTLQQQGVGMTAAEMHGLLSGLLCGGNLDASWTSLVHDLTNEGQAFPIVLSQPLDKVYQATRAALEGDDFGFQLMMPDTDDTIFMRADALSGWVNHFLLGLGMMQPKLAQIKGEVNELITDLRNIAQLSYEEDEDQEELEQALEEVAEYVRMGAIMCHTEFSLSHPTAPDREPPTLH